MINKFLLLSIGILFTHVIFAQIPDGYYNNANGKTGYTLKTTLHNIIKAGHNARSYDDLYDAYVDGDTDPEDGYVWDMYSENPNGTDPYNFTHYSEKCGQYSSESDCYNREHLFPQGIFGSASPMKTDYHHVVPSDGKVNGMRSSYPFGEVGTASWTSLNGSKRGSSSYPGYSGTVFEPIDEYKGDIARCMLYFATRYEDKVASWSHAMINGTRDQVYEDWFISLLLKWHNQDPVSQKEITRNNVGYSFQGNRNPFIDHPEYACEIWGGDCGNTSPSITDIMEIPSYPTSSDAVSITATITDNGTISNAELHWGLNSGSLTNTINMSVSSGDTFITASDIPAQSNGVTVYYEIEATDDEAEIKRTSVKNYSVSDNPLITLIEEDFETCSSDWTTKSVSGSEDWICGEGLMQVNAYESLGNCDDWLISPALDLDSYENEILNFKSWTKYEDIYHPIQVKYSTDYSGTGDPVSATWNNLTATWSAENSEAWTISGNIDLSGIIGSEVYIAFHYTSSGTGGGSCALWQIDDILLTGNNIITNNESPIISNVLNSPTDPTDAEDVTVSATINDSDGTIESAKIKWGTVSGSLVNVVSMTISDNNYSGVIPAQTGGTTIYYLIEAVDNEPETVISTENSYSVSTTNGIDKTLKENVNIYPNPTKDKINIELNDNVLIKSVQVFNLIGEKIMEYNYVNESQIRINLEQFSKGFYMIQVNSSNSTIVKKIMLK